jgi:hypothetical protein
MRAIASFIVTLIGLVLMFVAVVVLLGALAGMGLACVVFDLAERIERPRSRLRRGLVQR